VISDDTFNYLLGAKQRFYTPLSDHLFEVLREPFESYVDDDTQYHLAFNRFEYIRALFELDQRPRPYPAIGRFGWQRRATVPDVREDIDAEIAAHGTWPPIREGWFQGRFDRFRTARNAVEQIIGELSWH
jgi:hypothetical protein